MKKYLLAALAMVLSIGFVHAQCTNRPVINSFSPNTGFIGSTVTIVGANFDANTIANNQVYFGATQALVISATFGTLTVVVPVGASTAPISVKNHCNLTAYSATPFNGIFCPTPITNSTYQNVAFDLTGVYGAYNMFSQDMDLDGKPDVVSVGTGGVTIARNNSTPGSLSFSAYNSTPGGQQGYPVDMDGDGYKDIVFTHFIRRNMSTGPGSFLLGPGISTNSVSSYQIAAGDFNNDGKIDIVGEWGGSMYIAFNTSTGPGNISISARQNVGFVQHRCTGIQVADVDGDGKTDILATQGNGNRAVTLRNITTPGSFTASFEAPEYWASNGNYPYRCQVADFDKDGKIDLTTCNYNPPANTAIYRNTSTVGDISFAPTINLPAPQNNYRIGVGDVDGDGYPDIVTKSLGVNVFSVYPNTTTGPSAMSFGSRFDYTSSHQAEVSGIVIGDLDGDYVPDIATSGISSGRIKFHRNTSSQQDVTAPTAICKNITVALDPNGNVTITPEDVDNGSSDACGIDNLSISQSTFTCQDIGANNVTLVVTDNAGNQDSCVAVVNVAPAAIIVSGQTTVCDGQTVPLTANTGDSYQWKKDGVVISGATAQTYTATATGDYTVIVTNSGGCSGESDPTAITVNSNPTVNVSPSPNAYLCPNSVALTASTSSIYQWKKDGVDIPGANVQTYTATSTGVYSVEVIDLFGCSATSSGVTVSTSVSEIDITGNGNSIADGDNTPSTADGTDYGSVFPNVNNDQTFTISNSGSGNMVVSSITTGGANASNWNISGISLPATVASGSSATFVASFNGPSLGTYAATITVSSDDCDETAYDFAVAAEITCVASSFTSCPVNQTVNTSGACNAVATYTVQTNGAPAPALSYAFSGATTGSGSGDGSGSVFNVGTTTVTLVASNPCGNDTCSFDVVVEDNVAPTASAQNLTVQLDASGSASITANQVDNGSSDACGVASLSVSPNSFDCSNVGANSVTLTATDNNGNSSTATATVTIEDNVAPAASAQNLTVQLDASGSASITANQVDNGSSDACGVASLSVSPNSFDCSNVGANSVTLTVTDNNGNSSTATATVTVEDNVAPAALCQNVTVTLANGVATVTPAQVDNGSNDACGIASMSLDEDTWGCDDIGTHPVTLTVTDNNGNSATCSATVTVVGEIPTCSITSSPSSNVFTGGDPNVLYLGYGAQSTTLQTTVSGGSGFSYSWTGSNLSCTNCASPVFTPTAAGIYDFDVTVTNDNGCTTTCSISVCVRDIRVYKNNGQIQNGKVYLCHVPPGNNSNPQTLSISVNAVASHLGNHNGDALGACGSSCNWSGQSSKVGELFVEDQGGEEYELIVYPNPSNEAFTVVLESTAEEAMTVRLYDVAGKLVEAQTGMTGYNQVSVGQSIVSGIYFIHVTQGDYNKVVKVKRF